MAGTILSKFGKVMGEPFSIAVTSGLLAILTFNNISDFFSVVGEDLSSRGVIAFMLFLAYAFFLSALFRRVK